MSRTMKIINQENNAEKWSLMTDLEKKKKQN